MNFILIWMGYYILINFCMCFDNYMWIPADRKWYYTKEWKKHFKPRYTIKGKEYFLIPQNKEGWKIIFSRIKAVLTHTYDIVPAIISATILTIINFMVGF
jgi:hypothetical protein